ncbi:hypothetical protein [Herpetosiphon sp. NSE202]|uniref:hypothetical protein n=1 Tax=Herpetosiphon sp. NSE202 TaxID=3351349 RepID=UPI003628B649
MEHSDEIHAGLSILELQDLSLAERSLIRAILRQREVAEPNLGEALAALPDVQAFSSFEIQQALTALLEQHYLLLLAGEPRRYKVNLRTKASNLPRANNLVSPNDQPQARRSIDALWNALDQATAPSDLPNFDDQV